MIKTYYEQVLPHIQPIGATFFVTFFLRDALPKAFLEKIKQEYDGKVEIIKFSSALNKDDLIYIEQKIYFKKLDDALDKTANNVYHLKNSEIAQLIAHKIEEFDNQYYHLLAYSIMPNHVHLVVDFSIQIKPDLPYEDNYKQLYEVMKLIKGNTGYYANKILNKTGSFWQKESYDHYVRNQKELANIVFYTLNNPVKAGLVEKIEDWPYSFTCYV